MNLSDYYDTTQCATLRVKDHVLRTPWDKDSFLWALLGFRGAISESHMDAGGYATFVRPLLGYKLWIVAKQDLMPNHRGWPGSKGEWQAIVLSPKDDL